MTVIHIVITKSGDPIVLDFEEATRPGALVIWHISSQRTDIDTVKIAFDDADALFFSGSNAALASLGYHHYDSNDLRTCLGDTVIWGRAPANLGKRRVLKYWIFGLADNAAQVVALDPKIVIDDPPI